MQRHTLVIATANPGKLAEFTELLRELPVHLRSLRDIAEAVELREDGATYAANAVCKARVVARVTGYAALADDSGLEVDALHGAPGVQSARYAGPVQDSVANVRKLLGALAGVPPTQRGAQFRCVLAVVCSDGAAVTATGSCAGRILEAPRGAGGFGYDPVFFYPPFGRTFAEVPSAVKHRLSHRGRACRALRPYLIDFLTAHATANARRGSG